MAKFFNSTLKILMVVLLFFAEVQISKSQDQPFDPPMIKYLNHPLVDSVMLNLDLDQKIGQLFMAPAYSNRDSMYLKKLLEDIKKWQIGGVIAMQGGPVRHIQMVNQLQEISEAPLMVAMDAEWGPKMRLDSTIRLPYQMTLGAVEDDSLIMETGNSMARQLKRLGVHINFSPVADVNSNPENPVINFRSFGEKTGDVAWKSFLLSHSLQKNGILAVAKHFPGHGDTDVDSHLGLPVINRSMQEINLEDLYPFKTLISNGIGGIMTAHMSIPVLDSTSTPASISTKITGELLQNELNFEGLIFTDALNMKGATEFVEPGMLEVKALLAGNDVLLFSEDVGFAIQQIKNALKIGVLSEERIDRSCRKILAAKYWLGLFDNHRVDTANAIGDLNLEKDEYLVEQLSIASITCLKNDNIPVADLEQKTAIIQVGDTSQSEFSKMMLNYAPSEVFKLPHNATKAQLDDISSQIVAYDLVVWSISGLNVYPGNQFGASKEVLNWIDNSLDARSIVVLHGNPYLFRHLPNINLAGGVLVTYQELEVAKKVAAQVIYGALSAKGRLPVTCGKHFTVGQGVTTKNLGRISYQSALSVGVNTDYFTKVDEKVAEAIKEKATPGCQVLALKDGVVFFQKSYGYHTYDSIQKVNNSDLYDIASITKIAGALPGIMKLYEDGLLDIDGTFGDYMPYFNRKSFKEVTIREALAHQAGLYPWIPFWKEARRKNGKYKWFTFKEDSSRRFPHKIADNLYAHRKFNKKVYKSIRNRPLDEKTYKYSGLSFYLYPELIRCLSKEPYWSYIDQNFYRPLGASRLTYFPLDQYSLNQVIPTEYDSLFRKQLIHGTVHDEGAALMQGMSSNAGLFSNANDLAKLMQMYLLNGTYGGKHYLDSATIAGFTSCQFCEDDNRRGLGFDRPLPDPHQNGNTAVSVSQKSFGHSGFTGTFAWVDPEYNFVYIFLSNRVYPTRENKKLFQLNTRTDIQQLFYESFGVGL